MLVSWVLSGRYKGKRTQLRSMVNRPFWDPKTCNPGEELDSEEGESEGDMIEDNVKRGKSIIQHVDALYRKL